MDRMVAAAARLWADLSEKPKNLRDVALMNPLSDMRLADVVRYGGFEMPAFADIRGERLIALVAHVRSLSFPDLREIELQPLTQGSVTELHSGDRRDSAETRIRPTG